MAIKCLDCGSEYLKASAEGRCIGCDSYNLHRLSDSAGKSKRREKEPKTLIEIFVMILVWGLLLYGIWDRYLKSWLNT